MSPSSRKGPVLVVDDDADMREALKAVLEDEGYEIAEASDGTDALQYLRTHPPPPLILLDWNMAPMNGPQFMEALRHEPTESQVPVVLVTADARYEEKAKSERFAAHLKKPLDLEDLFSVVETYCH